jgi:ATP-dependent Clp protease ATP-binding subunit ClpA
MADRFDKFTERARRVLSLAQEEAQRFNHNYIGTEHLLLGLVREGDGVAAKVLANLGVELNKVRSAVEVIIGRGDRAVLGEIGLTPRAKKVLDFAVDEARRLNHHYIGTEHILLGLVREGEGIAAGVLESLGVNLTRVRLETTRILSQSMPQGAATSAAPEPADLRIQAEPGLFHGARALGVALSDSIRVVLLHAADLARERGDQQISPAHLLLATLQWHTVAEALHDSGADVGKLTAALEALLDADHDQG